MAPKKAHTLDVSLPFGHKELLASLRELEEAYPFLEIGYLGTSVLERGIPLVKIGKGRRKLLYVGGLGGTESFTSALLTRFLWELAYASHKNARIGHLHYRSVFETHTILVVPMLNPDGIEYCLHGVEEDNPLRDRLTLMNCGRSDFSSWQANARGVDLCHNYDAGFEEYRTRAAEEGVREPSPEKYAGFAPESEPETGALCNLIRYHEELLGVLSLSTGQRGIHYRQSDPTSAPTARIAARLARITAYPISASLQTPLCASLIDWCTAERGVRALSVSCAIPASHEAPLTYAELREALFTFPILL